MKKRIIVSYNPATGDIDGPNNYHISNMMLPSDAIEEESTGVGVDEIVKLKNAGFSAEEIIELKRKEVIG